MYSSLATGAAGGPAKKCACYDTNFRHRQRFLIPGARQSPVMPTPQAPFIHEGIAVAGEQLERIGPGLPRSGARWIRGPPATMRTPLAPPAPAEGSLASGENLVDSLMAPSSLFAKPGRSTGFTDCMPPESPGIRQTSIRAMTKHQSENTSSAAARTSAQSVRAEQSERKRAAILKASKEVLAQGYAEFSLRKVAAAAGAAQHRAASFRRSGVAHSCNDRLLDRGVHALFQTTGARPVRVPDR